MCKRSEKNGEHPAKAGVPHFFTRIFIVHVEITVIHAGNRRNCLKCGTIFPK